MFSHATVENGTRHCLLFDYTGKRIVQFGGIKPIVEMINHPTDINITIDALKALKNLLLEGSRGIVSATLSLTVLQRMPKMKLEKLESYHFS